MPVSITRRTKPARSARGKSPARASVRSAMTRRGGPQPSAGINGSPHGTQAQKAVMRRKTVERDTGRKTKGKAAIDRRKKFGQF